MRRQPLRQVRPSPSALIRWLAAIVAIGCLGVSVRGQVGESGSRPKLLVLLVVDQMRGDYVDKFQQQWTGGLHRLLGSGAWFRQADYPYFNTFTCPGHATIATGSLPSVHGMIMNEWWDRGRGAEVTCVSDPAVTPVSYGRALRGFGDSAAKLRASTLADEARAQLSPAARTISFSLKARSAITLAGHRPDAIAWFTDSGAWATSTAFSKAPVPAVADFIRRHPVENDLGKVWERALRRERYVYGEVAVGARPPTVMTASFPHVLGGASTSPDRAFYVRWQMSPFADEYLARMALGVAETMRLGQGGTTDVLAIGFSTLDRVGHDYGPRSHEVQDVLIRLDRTLGTFFDGLDRLVGRGEYTVALTADHGVAPIPEQARDEGLRAGRVFASALGQSVDRALQRVLGRGRYVAKVVDADIYLVSGTLDRMRRAPAAVAAVRQALEVLPGVERVFTRDEILAANRDGQGADARLARSFDRDRSGDLFVVLAPYWIGGTDATTHGSAYLYDTRVPLLLMGRGIKAGQYLEPSSPLDIAPTLAFLSGITLPHTDGRILTEAVASGFAVPATARPVK